MTDTTNRPTISEAVSELKMREWDKIEKLTGKPFSNTDMLSSSTFITALYFVYNQREDKQFTWADAQDASFADINGYFTAEPEASEEDATDEVVVAPKSEAA